MSKLSLLTGLLMLVAFTATVDALRLRTCGLKLIKRLRNICTPEGYSEPCVHAPEDFAPIDKRSSPPEGHFEEYDPGMLVPNARPYVDLTYIICRECTFVRTGSLRDPQAERRQRVHALL